MLKKFKAWREQRQSTTYHCLKEGLMENNPDPRNIDYRGWASRTARVEQKDVRGVVDSSSGLDLARYDADNSYKADVLRNGRVPKKPLSLEIKEVWMVGNWKELKNQAADVGNWIAEDLVEDWAKAVIYTATVAALAGGPSYILHNAVNKTRSALVEAKITAEQYMQQKKGSSQMQIEGYPQGLTFVKYDGVGGTERSPELTLNVKDLYGGFHSLSYVTTPEIANLTHDYFNAMKGKRCVIPVDKNRVAGIRCEQ